MTDYKYAEPKDAREASDRIDYWMGDLGEFQAKLGLHDPGNDREPYYPQYSGILTENSRLDTMIAVDQKLRPDKWLEPVTPVPPLRDDWLATLIRTRDEVKQFIDTWTDLDHVKAILRTLVKDTTRRVQLRLLGWLGEKPLPSKPAMKPRPAPWPVGLGEFPYDPGTYAKVQKEIEIENLKGRVDDPRNDGTLFT